MQNWSSQARDRSREPAIATPRTTYQRVRTSKFDLPPKTAGQKTILSKQQSLGTGPRNTQPLPDKFLDSSRKKRDVDSTRV